MVCCSSLRCPWFTYFVLLCFLREVYIRGDRTSSDNASWARTVHARTTAFDTPLSAVTQAEECPCQTHARWRTAGGAVRMSPRWLLVYSRGAAHKAQRQCALVTAPTPPHAHGAAALLWSRRHNQPELLVSSVDVDRLRARPVFASRSWGRGRGGCHKSPGDICWGASRIDDSRNSWRRPGLLAHAAPWPPSGLTGSHIRRPHGFRTIYIITLLITRKSFSFYHKHRPMLVKNRKDVSQQWVYVKCFLLLPLNAISIKITSVKPKTIFVQYTKYIFWT